MVEVLVVVLTVVFLIHWKMFSGKVIPRILVSGMEVSGINEVDLKRALEERFKEKPNEVVLEYNGDELMKITDLQINYDFDWTAKQAMGVGRNGNLLTQIKERVVYFIEPLNIEPAISYDGDELAGLISLVDEQVKQEYKPAMIGLNKEGRPEFVVGVNGVWVNE